MLANPHGVCCATMLNPPTLFCLLAESAYVPKFHGLDSEAEKKKYIFHILIYTKQISTYKYIHRDLFYEFTINESLICCTCSCSICSLSKVCTTIAVVRLGVSSGYFNESRCRGTTFCSGRLYQLSEQRRYKYNEFQ